MTHDFYMRLPTQSQLKWAADSWIQVAQDYAEWTSEKWGDYGPMLRLIEHICSTNHVQLLSAGRSLSYLSVAYAAHVYSPHRLSEGAPSICILQSKTEFKFLDAQDRGRPCPFEKANELFDTKLVTLKFMAETYERRRDAAFD